MVWRHDEDDGEGALKSIQDLDLKSKSALADILILLDQHFAFD